jgi:hypothetical protein
MSHDGRASSASVPEITVVEPEDRDGVCAAGSPLTLAQQDREALRRLCEVGRMIRRTDGNYGTPRERLITMAVARRLKKRGLATPGFDKDMFPSTRGKELNAEAIDAATR